MKKHNTLARFRKIALAEGISFLILLFVAMPIKYFGGISQAVTYTGWVHGLLFVLFVGSLVQVWEQYGWGFAKIARAMVASLLPFGTFFFERELKKEYGEL